MGEGTRVGLPRSTTLVCRAGLRRSLGSVVYTGSRRRGRQKSPNPDPLDPDSTQTRVVRSVADTFSSWEPRRRRAQRLRRPKRRKEGRPGRTTPWTGPLTDTREDPCDTWGRPHVGVDGHGPRRTRTTPDTDCRRLPHPPRSGAWKDSDVSKEFGSGRGSFVGAGHLFRRGYYRTGGATSD